MTFIEALLLSIALCVDSLMVSATTAFRSHISFRHGLLMAIVFGLCQAVIPLLGALIGDVARELIETVDHWVAFGLLAFVGAKMIIDVFRSREEEASDSRPKVSLGEFFLLGIATSIDAFAVGISLGLQEPMHTVLWVVAVIGVVTLLVSLAGVMLGKRKVPIPERTANIIAGIVLISLGVKILLEHLLG